MNLTESADYLRIHPQYLSHLARNEVIRGKRVPNPTLGGMPRWTFTMRDLKAYKPPKRGRPRGDGK